jgi:hypothetical protein
MKRFYFRVQKTKQSDLVICVGAPDLQAAEAAANEYFVYPPWGFGVGATQAREDSPRDEV